MIVIGLTGRAGAGKGVVADHLVAEHGFTKLSFAAPLKKMLRTLDPIITRHGTRLSTVFDGYSSEAAVKASQYGTEYRRLLQVLGTDCIRAHDENFWVRAALKQLTDRDGRYVFDDVRFPNEAQAVKSLNYSPRGSQTHQTQLWRIVRPGHDGGAGNHVSEQHADTIPAHQLLDNDDTVESLQWLVNVLAEELTK